MLSPKQLRRRLKELFDCEPEVGLLRWRVPYSRYHHSRRAAIGSIAGKVHSTGYRFVYFDGTKYRNGHLVWLWMTGELPPKGTEIDHRDGNKANDAWLNLRLVTRQQNMCNKRAYRSNSTGFKGVYPHKKRFKAKIQVAKQAIYLGSFPTPWRAYRAYCAAARKYHGEFARTV